ncbi:DUF2306 domain-containing protein [Devosia sp. MC521]|uniref:DUF2306 domain-containing protein n=1 Tax=Devosia sp. MC521 TaxID=2759954 RepID=UPI0015FBBEA8|nr:DUF2306 domain-containing protein [Devosia sp. MC521]MBJ6987232.1 DUF2306 domain-containing protein [Devosia sp. MC521]QMW62844.1 DUF2306 domain-containing protein [Devosia sp. MC521]
MSLTPLLNAGLVIQIHVIAAIAAFLLGALVLWRRKGTRLHKALGKVWVVLMLVVATSSLFIHEGRLFGPFSPIHILTLVTYIGIGQALWAIKVQRDVVAHRAGMQGTYIGALLLAGAFTFLPGRRMHAVLFGAEAGWTPSLVIIALALSVAALSWWRLLRGAHSVQR